MKRLLKALVVPVLLVGFNQVVRQFHSHQDTAAVTQTAVSASQKSNTGPGTGQETAIPIQQAQYTQLAAKDYQPGDKAVVEVNGSQSTLDIANWHYEHAFYGELDSLNRTTCVTAYLSQKNLGRSKGRERQIWRPTGWHQKRLHGQEIYNRGHLLAYTSSFNFDQDGNFKHGAMGSIDNPKNLATQTAYANQKLQTYYETLVRRAQQRAGNHVLYQIVTVFRVNEKMPRGYWLQAKDSQGTLNFNVYEFNIQPGVTFDYTTGASHV